MKLPNSLVCYKICKNYCKIKINNVLTDRKYNEDWKKVYVETNNETLINSVIENKLMGNRRD